MVGTKDFPLILYPKQYERMKDVVRGMWVLVISVKVGGPSRLINPDGECVQDRK